MTNRERWIVYPLLFFAMTMGFKANYLQPLEFKCQSIECQRLVVQDNLRVPRINGTAALGNPAVRPAQIRIDPAQALNALKQLTESSAEQTSEGTAGETGDASAGSGTAVETVESSDTGVETGTPQQIDAEEGKAVEPTDQEPAAPTERTRSGEDDQGDDSRGE